MSNKCKICIHEQASIIDNNVAICAPCWLELYGDEDKKESKESLEKPIGGPAGEH